MSYNGNKDWLVREADRLEALVEGLPKIGGQAFSAEWRAAHDRHREAAAALAEDLRGRASPRATIGGSDHAALRMSMLGVRCSCTSGLAGLFRNWIAAARRKSAE